MDKPDIDALVTIAQQFHETIEAIVRADSCGCPVCVGNLEQCEECDGLFLVKDEVETAEYDEYEEEELRGSPIEFLDEAEDDHAGSPTTKKLFMDLESEHQAPIPTATSGARLQKLDLEEIEESMAQVVLSSGHAR